MRATVMLTAVEQKLPVIAVVFDNRSLQIEREAMFKIYGRESLCDYRIKGENDLWGPDFAKMAEGMGCVGIRVDKAEDFKPAFEAAIASGKADGHQRRDRNRDAAVPLGLVSLPEELSRDLEARPGAGSGSQGFEMPTFARQRQLRTDPDAQPQAEGPAAAAAAVLSSTGNGSTPTAAPPSPSRNPATGEAVGTVPQMGAAEARRAIEAAEVALTDLAQDARQGAWTPAAQVVRPRSSRTPTIWR